MENINTINERYVSIDIKRKNNAPPPKTNPISIPDLNTINQLNNDIKATDKINKQQTNNDGNQCTFTERNIDSPAIMTGFKSVEGNYFQPVFHSQTPEDFHRRLTFLNQCVRQGAALRSPMTVDNDNLRAKNSAFGRQPICILRIGDFFFTKVIIEQLNVDYTETIWDMNPEGRGMQPLLARITLQMKVLGGQSLKGPIDALQNAVSFNYYANSSFSDVGMYKRPSIEADKQEAYINGILNGEIEKAMQYGIKQS